MAIAEGRYDHSDYEMSTSGDDEYENYSSGNGYENVNTTLRSNINTNNVKAEEKVKSNDINMMTSNDKKILNNNENNEKSFSGGMTIGGGLECGSSSKQGGTVNYGILTQEPTASTNCYV